ncbi:hypothetical protein KEH51_04855 [[Brevibacterium] frigoritolerans]|uniref:Uncharacterized protein n=1 Tax=Peribacillus frigoritolerans TaxID=450367 RepID=A0A941FHQ4_9BACI|nr:hypothetical protein [Peribacillus frigoritolerans]
MEKKESSRDIISRLSNHQGFPKPLCEAVINGEKLRFHVLGMRGESVKIKEGTISVSWVCRISSMPK